MNSDKFLSAVADYYISASQSGEIDLSEICLVFPNKRAAIFFRRYFKQRASKLTFIPDINTIGAFNERFCDKQVADSIQLQFILYRAYCKVANANNINPMPFERFAFWGNMILSDFDDIDKSLADAHKLFTNLKRYKEISSNFLSDEQLKVVASIWGESVANGMKDDNGHLWKHYDYPDDPDEKKSYSKFYKLWNILDPLYTEFNNILASENLAYPGLVSREIATNFHISDLEDFSFRRVGFVGFNMVNLAQAKFMQTLKDNNAADFFWDLLPNMSYADRAGARTRDLAKLFPMPLKYVQPVYNINDCKIDVYGVPSNTLQAKATGNILDRWKSFINTDVPDNTVVVLPEPALLSPVLNALPPDLGKINITMGLSYRDTPFATLLRTIISMHSRCRIINDEPYFFHEDISTLVANPNMRAVAFDSCLAIKAHLDQYHQFMVHADKLKEIVTDACNLKVEDVETLSDEEKQKYYGGLALCNVFTGFKKNPTIEQTRSYLDTLLSALDFALTYSAKNINHGAHEIKILAAYKEAIDKVFDYINKYHMTSLFQGSIFIMLDRLMAVNTLNMSGTPLSGMQIMGVLETRAVDFENVIILSMNERVYPRRNRMHTLIPQLIRNAFLLETQSASEQEYSYYFFRLFSRSKRVVCIYDSRSNGAGNGAMSRYLLQFKYLFPTAHIKFDTCSTYAKQSEKRVISIEKTDAVLSELQAFKTKGPGKLNISASALKTYRKCPLEFYFKYVKCVREEDEPTGYMDSATYGSVMHAVLEDLFNEQRENPKIDETRLHQMKQSRQAMVERVKRKINELYHRGSYDVDLAKMPGESHILAELMADSVIQILNKEVRFVQKNKPFTFVESEEKVKEQWAVTPNNTINFRLDIDRHDILDNGQHRFVDYKTGKDKVVIKSIEEMFQDGDNANDAAFQLFTYAAAYSDIKNVDIDIRPALYLFRTLFIDDKDDSDMLRLAKTKEGLVWKKKSSVPDDPDYWQNDFRRRLNEMIDSIFDANQPFIQTENKENCRYCPFLQICAREVPEKKY